MEPTSSKMTKKKRMLTQITNIRNEERNIIIGPTDIKRFIKD